MILSQSFPPFPACLPLAVRVSPLLEQLAAKGHRLMLCDLGDGLLPEIRGGERVKLRPPALSRFLGGARPGPVPPGRMALLKDAIGEAVAGEAIPPRPTTFPGDWGAPVAETGWTQGWAVKQARQLGADLVLATPPHGPADLLLLNEPIPAYVSKLQRNQSGELRGGSGLEGQQTSWLAAVAGAKCVISPGGRQARLVAKYGSRDSAVVALGPDTEIFSPNAAVAGEALRSKLGIGAGELVCLWLPPSWLGDGAEHAARAFAELSAGGAGVRDRMRFLFPGTIPGPVSAILKGADCLERAAGVPVPDAAAWAALLGAANVAVCPCLYDPAGWTVLEAVACGCPVVTTLGNGAAHLLQPGSSGEVVAKRTDAGGLAAAMVRLLATERAQRSRAFVAMAAHLPRSSEAADRVEELAVRQFEAQLCQAVGIAERSAGALRRSSLPPPEPEQWVDRDTLCIAGCDHDSRLLLKDTGLTIPAGCWRPTGEHVIDGDADSVRCAWRTSAGGGRDRLFASARVGTVFVTTWASDPDTGPRSYWLSRRMQACGLNVPAPLGAGSNGRSSFLVQAGAAGLPLPEFLRTGGKQDHAAGRVVRRHALTAVADALALAHRAGFGFGILEADTVFCALEPTGGVRVTFASLANATGPDLVPARLPGRADPRHMQSMLADLLWLALSVRGKLVPASERVGFLRRWIAGAGIAMSLREVLAEMTDMSSKLRPQREAWVERHRVARDERAKARLAKGELVPARAEDL